MLSCSGAEEYVGKDRIRAIADGVQRRIENLSHLAMNHAPVQDTSTEDDVEEDIAEDYTPKMEL